MLRRRVSSLLLGLASIAPALPAAALPSGVAVDVAVNQPMTVSELVLSDSGHVTYRWNGGGDFSGINSWTREGGTTTVAQIGQPAPGGGSFLNFGYGSFTNYGFFVVGDGGDVTFRNAVNMGGGLDGSNNGLWGPGAGGALALLARYGQALPGDASGGLMSAQDSPIGGFPGTLSVSGVTVDDAGRTLFGATFQIGPGGVTSSNDGVLYQSDGAGSGSILAREGDPVTGAAPGTAYAGSFAGLESQAGIAFRASTTAGSGLFTEDTGGAFAPLVMEGDAAPGTSGAVFGGFFLPFSPGRIDANGTLMFQNTLQSGIGGVTSANDTGFWGPNGLIAREGDQAPGAPAGALFQGFAGVELDDAGFAFRAALQTGPGGVTSANNTGLWRPDDDGGVILLTREGDAVPGLPGVSFADLASAAVAVNAQGETAFLAGFTIGSGGVTTANDKALFFADAHGLLTLLLREGDILPGLGTLQSLEALGGLNEAGQIAVKAFFAPSGAPVNTVVLLLSIPEPSIAWMLGFGFALLGAQRRRH